LYLDAHFKAQRLQQVKTEMTQIFQATLPDEKPVQPVYQLQDKVQAIKEQLRTFGGLIGTPLSGLETLREISETVPSQNGLTLNVDSLSITPNVVDIVGTTNSYEDAQKLRDALEASPGFEKVTIVRVGNNASNKVEFKLTIAIAKSQEPVT
jgi:Tfp pilus assembly protein PilN